MKKIIILKYIILLLFVIMISLYLFDSNKKNIDNYLQFNDSFIKKTRYNPP